MGKSYDNAEARRIRYHVSGKICTSVPATHARSRDRSFEIHGGGRGDYPSRSPAYVRYVRLLEFVSWGHFPSVKASVV